MCPRQSPVLQRNIILPGGCHKGELTKLGQQQAREVGEWLRQRYVDQLGFLPAQYEVNALMLKWVSSMLTMIGTILYLRQAMSQKSQPCRPLGPQT